MFEVYIGIIYFERFAGVKAGKSMWSKSLVKTRKFYISDDAYKEMNFLKDHVLPATNVRIYGYSVETYFEYSNSDND